MKGRWGGPAKGAGRGGPAKGPGKGGPAKHARRLEFRQVADFGPPPPDALVRQSERTLLVALIRPHLRTLVNKQLELAEGRGGLALAASQALLNRVDPPGVAARVTVSRDADSVTDDELAAIARGGGLEAAPAEGDQG